MKIIVFTAVKYCSIIPRSNIHILFNVIYDHLSSNFVLAQLQIQGVLYWPEVKPRANTADRGPVTGPIRNYLINDNFIN